MDSGVVVVVSGGAEGTPYVAVMYWSFVLKVMKPEEDWGLDQGLSEGGKL
jgi:hypothetical protein